VEIAVGLLSLRYHNHSLYLRLLINVRFEVDLYDIHRTLVQTTLWDLAILKL